MCRKRIENSLAVLLLCAFVSFAQAPRPNIIIIVADDMGYGDLGCFGSTQVSTPNIDKLAAQGLKFTDFHSNGSVCSPTRAALMTGMYPQRAGVASVVKAAGSRETGLDTAFITMPKMLKKAGYRTALFGKWHLGYKSRFNPVRHGFDEYQGFVAGNVDFFSYIDQEGYYDWWIGTDSAQSIEGYLTGNINRLGLDYIHRNADGPPFFLFLAHGAPHYPYQGPNDEAFRKERPKAHPINVPGQTAAQRSQKYKEMIEYMDMGIGQVIDTIKALGIEERTLVMFFTDNGHYKVGSSGGLKGAKGSIYEGGHRVPAVAWWPGTISPGRTTDETVVGFDLYPTFAAMAGITVSGLDAMDVSPVFLENGATLPERALYWFSNGNYAMRKGKWKLNRVNNKFTLFNLETDIKESTNLAASQSTVRNEMVDTFKEWQKTAVKTIPEVTWTIEKSSTKNDGAIVMPLISAHEETTAELFTLNGRRVYRAVVMGGRIDPKAIAGLATGMYRLRVTTQAASETRTIFHRRTR